MNKLLESDENNHLVLIAKAATLSDLKRKEEALECYKKIVNVNASDWKKTDLIVVKNMSSILHDLKRYQEALDLCEKILEMDKEPKIFVRKGEILKKLNNKSDLRILKKIKKN